MLDKHDKRGLIALSVALQSSPRARQYLAASFSNPVRVGDPGVWVGCQIVLDVDDKKCSCHVEVKGGRILG